MTTSSPEAGPDEALHVIEAERSFAAPEGLVWALIADTNRWDRAMGARPTRYEWREVEAGAPDTRARVGQTVSAGQEVSFIEVGEWLESSFIWGERQFLSGPFHRVGYRFGVRPKDGASVASGKLYFTTRPSASERLTQAMQASLSAAVQRYFDALETLFRRAPALEDSAPSDPPSSLARRMLLDTTTDLVTMGEASPADDSEWQVRTRRFAEAPVEARVRTRLLDLLRHRPDDDVLHMRPFELARAWRLPRRDVLVAFLHAARAGLCDLEWQLNCPTCRVGSQRESGLTRVERRAHCEDCDIDYDVDFAENVEAVFNVNPALRRVEPKLYCAGSPMFRPHVFGLLSTLPHAARELTVTLPEGLLLARALKAQRRGAVAIGPVPPRVLDVRVTADQVVLSTEPRAPGEPGNTTRLKLENETDEPVTLTLERSGWNADIVLGSVILTLPEFLDLFSTEAPAAGVDLSIGALTILFSDLTGITALYDRMGDSKAFAVVEAHFRSMAGVIARHGGALVKTMGDAVMAAFTRPPDAVAAALEMVERARSEADRAGLPQIGIKIGLHEGPCLAVRANDRLDFYGRTVNLASRLQAQAKRDRLVVTADLMDHPAVEELVRTRGLVVEHFRAELKGLPGTQSLLSMALPAG